MTDKTKWYNILSMLCPYCGKTLKGFIDIKCQDQNVCKFSISSKKFDALVKELYKVKPRYTDDSEERNLTELNNL